MPTDTDYSHVVTRVLDTACLSLTTAEFVDLAIACADQAGVDPATQVEIRRLIVASRSR